MLIKITETQKEYKVTLRALEDDQWQQDCFNDMEVNVPLNYPQVAGSDAYEMPQKDFDGLVEYWESECEDFNEGRFSEQFGEKEEDGCDIEYALFVTEIAD